MAVYDIDFCDSEDLKTGDIINCDYSGVARDIILRPGTYKLECWGAQGGDYDTTYLGGRGGYSIGTIELSEETGLFIYTGGAGEITTTTAEKFTGGFNGGGDAYGSTTSTYRPTTAGGASDIRIGTDSLYARVIVAGGGGGISGRYRSSQVGAGGGVSGTDATDYSTSYYGGRGGTQTSEGTSYNGTTVRTDSGASFGQGGGVVSSNSHLVGPGGGGWYGGGIGVRSGGGGGSGYVYTSSTAENYPEGCLLNSSMYLSNAATIAGNAQFDAPDGTSETGHSGNGYIRITILDIEPLDYDIYDIDDIAGSEVQLNFEYTGTVQTRTLQPGTYKLECWGAQGGNIEAAPGGLGGYSVGILTLSTSTTIYIYVGGQGVEAYDGLVSGGFNGGGNGQNSPSGGGASDIRIGQDSLYARVIVAGGGGSALYSQGGWGGGIRAYYFDDNDPIYTGGTQTGPGLPSPYSITATQPNFGIGGGANSTSLANYPNVAIVGGGGGWYGGSYLSDDDDLTPSTGGGSGYVYTEDTASNYPNGCLLNSSYYLHNAETVNGLDQDPDNYYRDDQKIPSPDNTGDYDYQGYELGHEGNGYVRITYVTSPNMPSLNPGDKIKCNYNGSSRPIQLPAGCYDIKCYGAQGGDAKALGGKGGYATGIIKLDGTEILYVYVGGQGTSTVNTSTNATGGFNGGGDARIASTSYHCGSGGGASDIRIDQDSLYARVIVAGGGGGSGGYNNTMNGGAGGGIEGRYGKQYSTSYYHGTGGTQTAAGISDYNTTADSTTYYELANFGIGGSAKSTSSAGYRAGGGGGWYGGGGAHYSGAGGGSGYVFTPDLAANYPTGCLLTHDYYLANGHLESDKKSGDGYIELKYLGNINLINIDDLSWHADLENILDFEYTGEVQTTTLTAGRYKFECWGAQGGSYSSTTYLGGNGGYSTGVIDISSPTTLYIYVGGQPPSTTSTTSQPGGFNGGGTGHTAYYKTSDETSYTYSYGQPGGGASDIRIGQDSLYARAIVAGGGGGSSSVTASTTKYGGGESGGSPGGDSYIGTQTTAGINGSFGQGANASTSYNYKYISGGGGGGWYGGGSNGLSDSASASRGYNGGGSGYVYTENTAINYPEGCLLDSSVYLTNAETIAGNMTFNSPNGASETGHTGNGHVRISKMTPPLNPNYKKNDIIYCYNNNDKRNISLPKGIFQFDIYGAQGGNGLYDYGGLGGYSTGILNIADDLSLYIYTGGQGILTTATSTLISGGFNGGGNAYTTSSSYKGGSGGGASDIRLGTDSLYARVIVAGGGGGAGTANSDFSYDLSGGIGGGTSGTDGGQYSTSYKAGTGGTQTAAGTSYYQTAADSTTYCTPASFGVGGSAGTTGRQVGGGGGWYGGGCSGYNSAGGGGSGYVYTENTASDYPEGCLLNSTYYLTDASTVNAAREGNGYIQITVLDVSSINAKVKIGGVWKDINSIYMKVGGEWKAANGLKVKTNGSWRDSS